MRSTIAVYDSHKLALEAVDLLVEAGYSPKQMSLVGKAELIDDHLHVRSNELLVEAPVSVGIITGSILGTLAGAGIFAVPGLGFLIGAGAIIGAFAGFDFGIVGGGLISLLITLGIKKEHAIKYDEHIKVNRFLVIAHGDEAELEKAKNILNKFGKHHELTSH